MKVATELSVEVGDTNSAVVAMGGMAIVDVRAKPVEVKGISVPTAVAPLNSGDGEAFGSMSLRSKSTASGLSTLNGCQSQRNLSTTGQ